MNSHPFANLFLFRSLKTQALAPFRLESLRKQIKDKGYNLQLQSCRQHFLVQILAEKPIKKEVIQNTTSQLARLLNAELLIDFNHTSNQQNSNHFKNCAFTIARKSTLSAFSTKAVAMVERIVYEQNQVKVSRIEPTFAWQFEIIAPTLSQKPTSLLEVLGDEMVHNLLIEPQMSLWQGWFETEKSKPTEWFDLQNQEAFENANQRLGLGLNEVDKAHLSAWMEKEQRPMSEVELMMWSGIHSEHCRHKIFNATFIIDGIKQDKSLFDHIKETSKKSPQSIILAYSDNAAIAQGSQDKQAHFRPHHQSRQYQTKAQKMALTLKAETHNHPTVVEPFAGAATGTGGEIRDEVAIGRGGFSKMGLVGFSVSHLHQEGLKQSFERFEHRKAPHKATSLEIMLKAPLGSARYGNEFGRPLVGGYLRVFEWEEKLHNQKSAHWGFYKPIMLAGGVGQVDAGHFYKKNLKEQAGKVLLIVLGDPSLEIGLGGGAASSQTLGSQNESLDFASVQRDNPESQRRCQEVINRCIERGEDNPILTIHDVGAAGLSNALVEVLADSNIGCAINLADIPIADTAMGAMAIWCNESQERYVLAIKEEDLNFFNTINQTERCHFAVVGVLEPHKNQPQKLTVFNETENKKVVDLNLTQLMTPAQNLTLTVKSKTKRLVQFKPVKTSPPIAQMLEQVLAHPSVASKAYLIHIADRSVTGLIIQDPCVGPYQVPVADCAISATSFGSETGEAVAMGERPALALLDSAKSVRIAAAEAMLNLLSADIELENVVMSANWMADIETHDSQDAQAYLLFKAVKALSQFCQDLSIAIPVGKDSLSMAMAFKETDKNQVNTSFVRSPVSLNITALSHLKTTQNHLTPQLQHTPSYLLRVQLGQNLSLNASILSQCLGSLCFDGDEECVDIEANTLSLFAKALRQLRKEGGILAYHDVSDGGLWASVVEMHLASRLSIEMHFDLNEDITRTLFNESPQVVIQVSQDKVQKVIDHFQSKGIDAFVIGKVRVEKEKNKANQSPSIKIYQGQKLLYHNTRVALEKIWSQSSYLMQKNRDNPNCADEEYASIAGEEKRLFAQTTFRPNTQTLQTLINTDKKPKVAVLRDQGVNGHIEMAHAFDLAGFDAFDVHIEQLITGQFKLSNFRAIALPGGFSYGDVLGAGRGMALSLSQNPFIKEQLQSFFSNPDTLGLGVCNGCQTLSQLSYLFDEKNVWPTFEPNVSQQYESRMVMVEIQPSASLFTCGMEGSQLPVVVAHAEGRAVAKSKEVAQLEKNGQIVMKYVNSWGEPTMKFPQNPNGSVASIASVCSQDGRFTTMMPHPERTLYNHQMKWVEQWGDNKFGKHTPWVQLFANARKHIL